MLEYPPGDYEFRIRGTVGNLNTLKEETTIRIRLVDPCPTVGTAFKNPLPFTDLTYVLGKPKIVVPFEELFKIDTLVDCGTIKYEFVTEDGSPVDETLFAYPKTDKESRIFTVLEQDDPQSVGVHRIRYKATFESYPIASPIILDNPFSVTISKPASPSTYVFNVMPDWMVALEDQYVVQGDSLIYSFGENVNFFGEETQVNVDFGKASIFANYVPQTHAVTIDATTLPTELVGVHRITV